MTTTPTVTPLEHPEVHAHLNKLKAEHKRRVERHLTASLGIRKRNKPEPPPQTLTLTIPLSAEMINAFKHSVGDWRMRIDAALLEIAKQE